jgi:GT2 family glycosyltransferase
MDSTIIDIIYVIDNSPTQNLKKSLICRKEIRYFHNPQNPGYGAGHNIGMRKSIDSGCEYHLVINADISFTFDVVLPLVEYMNQNSNIGAIMPRVIYPNGEMQDLCKFVPSPYDLIARAFLPKQLRDKNEWRFKMMDYDKSKILHVPYLSGCFMLLRNQIIKRVGDFDERFFMYPEDIDLSRRIRTQSHTIYYPHCTVVHRHEQASKKSKRMMLIHAINMIKYFNKWGWIQDKERSKINNDVREQNKGALNVRSV